MSIGQVVSTAGVPPEVRMAFWVEAVCETFLELKVDSKAGPRFEGSIETHDVGPLALNFMSFDDQHIVRTKQGISRGKLSEFYLVQPRDQPFRFTQLGRQIVVERGGCTLLDSRHPFEIENGVDRDTLSVAIPTDWLLTWLPAPEAALIRPWRQGDGWGGVLATALANLTPAAMGDLPVLPSIFCDQLGSLIAMAAASHGEPPVRPRASLLQRLHDTLRSAYHDQTLSPAEVARHHSISLRNLHLQFAAAGTSFSRELLDIRLENARRMLGDIRYARLSVGEIAQRCGFANASHFARRFRMRFGVSPTMERARC